MRDLQESIRRLALDLGFDAVGFAPAARAPHADAWLRWLDAGYAADMRWLARAPERRADPRRVMPAARSAVVVALSYFTREPPAAIWDDPARGRVARYAWGRDYHDIMRPMLAELAGRITTACGHPVQWMAFADNGPILEKDLAASAGLGVCGKNTQLIHPQLGSYVLLGELLLDLELDHDPPPTMADPCGDCEACRQVCPTGALAAPYTLDCRRCIAYLTIEHRGEIAPDLRPRLGRWVFGCNECLTACPWTRKLSQPSRRRFLDYDPDLAAPRLADALAWREADFIKRYGGTPVARIGFQRFLRNVRLAAENARSA